MMLLYRSSVYHSVITMAELAGVPRPNSGAGCRVGGPKRVLHILKNAESDAELRGLDADFLVTEHTLGNKAPGMQCRTYRAPGQMNPT